MELTPDGRITVNDEEIQIMEVDTMHVPTKVVAGLVFGVAISYFAGAVCHVSQTSLSADEYAKQAQEIVQRDIGCKSSCSENSCD